MANNYLEPIECEIEISIFRERLADEMVDLHFKILDKIKESNSINKLKVYITPKTFMDFLAVYIKIVADKKNEI